MNSVVKHLLVITGVISLCLCLQQCIRTSAEKESLSAGITIAEPEVIAADSASAVIEVSDSATTSGYKNDTRQPLVIIINNLQSATAPVIISLYDTSSNFPNPETRIKQYRFKPKSRQAVLYIKDVKFGEYALAVYQDENNNGEIGKNLLGMPTEGYAYSNNVKPFFKAPLFNECKFKYTHRSGPVSMTLVK